MGVEVGVDDGVLAAVSLEELVGEEVKAAGTSEAMVVFKAADTSEVMMVFKAAGTSEVMVVFKAAGTSEVMVVFKAAVTSEAMVVADASMDRVTGMVSTPLLTVLLSIAEGGGVVSVGLDAAPDMTGPMVTTCGGTPGGGVKLTLITAGSMTGAATAPSPPPPPPSSEVTGCGSSDPEYMASSRHSKAADTSASCTAGSTGAASVS